jgi:antitoxin HicB
MALDLGITIGVDSRRQPASTKIVHEYSYTVLFEPDERGGYVVTCPALPAVVTQGETLEEARAMAADAIHLVLQSLIDDGEPIPADIAARAHEPLREKVTVAV